MRTSRNKVMLVACSAPRNSMAAAKATARATVISLYARLRPQRILKRSTEAGAASRMFQTRRQGGRLDSLDTATQHTVMAELDPAIKPETGSPIVVLRSMKCVN